MSAIRGASDAALLVCSAGESYSSAGGTQGFSWLFSRPLQLRSADAALLLMSFSLRPDPHVALTRPIVSGNCCIVSGTPSAYQIIQTTPVFVENLCVPGIRVLLMFTRRVGACVALNRTDVDE